MLFFISNVALHVYQHLAEERLKMKILRLIRSHVNTSSVMLRKIHPGVLNESALTGTAPTEDLVPPECTTQLWADDSLEVSAVQPQLHINLTTWTSYLSTQCYSNSSLSAGNCHILLEVCQPKDQKAFLDQSLSVPPSRRVKVMDLTQPIAWKSGTPFCIVAECSPEALAELSIGLKEGRLMLDDMLELQCITTVSLEGSAVNLLCTDSISKKTADSSSLALPQTKVSPLVEHSLKHGNASWANLLDSLRSVLEDTSDVKGGLVSEVGSNESLASFPAAACYEDDISNPQQFLDGLSVKPSHASLLKVSHCESDSESSSVIGDTAAGEAPSDSLELLAPEVLTPAHRQARNRHKPPNVLIYCGKKDSTRQFEAVQAVFAQCLNPDRYAIYHLKHEQVHGDPWFENCVLLIVASDKVYDGVDRIFLDYFMRGGTVLSLGSGYDAQFVEKIQISKNIGVLSLCYRTWKDVTVICGKYLYKNTECSLPDVSVQTVAKDKQTGRPIIIEATHDITEGVSLLSQVNLDKDPAELAISPEIFAALKKSNLLRFEILRDLITQLGLDCSSGAPPSVTSCFLMATDNKAKKSLMAALQPRLQARLLRARELSLLFCNHDDTAVSSPTSSVLPVIVDATVSADKFDIELYKLHLAAKVLGHVVFYAEVINTTMNLFEGMMFSIPEEVGLITIASRQTKGQGRGGNTWLSPLGCAMFSLHVRIAVKSELGQRVAFLQHITSLAVVMAVNRKPGYENIDLCLKWPNDIYYGSTMKLGGVIVKSSIMADVIHANIGCGVNVSNADPTICINDLVHQYNQSHGANLTPFTVEEFIARTVTCIEEIIALFQEQGKEAFLELYYQKWLHSNACVHLQSENKDAIVTGLDNYGFLSVKTADGTVRSVHPDGNSFDMMQNLIIPKSR